MHFAVLTVTCYMRMFGQKALSHTLFSGMTSALQMSSNLFVL